MRLHQNNITQRNENRSTKYVLGTDIQTAEFFSQWFMEHYEEILVVDEGEIKKNEAKYMAVKDKEKHRLLSAPKVKENARNGFQSPNTSTADYKSLLRVCVCMVV